MGLVKWFKEKKRESQIERFYNHIKNAKYELKSMKDSAEAIYYSAKIHGALDLARNIGLIDTCQQFEIGNDVEAILKRVMNIIRYEQSLELKNTEEK